MRHNFMDKKAPKPQPDTTLTDHPVRTQLPKSAGQWGRPSPAEPGITVVRAPCKKETGTTERGRGSSSTQEPRLPRALFSGDLWNSLREINSNLTQQLYL